MLCYEEYERCIFSVVILLKCNLLFRTSAKFFFSHFFFLVFARNRVRLSARDKGLLPSVLDCDNLKGASKRSSKSISRPLPIARRIFVHSSYQLLLLSLLAQAIYLLLISLHYYVTIISVSFLRATIESKLRLLRTSRFRKLSIIRAPSHASASTLTGIKKSSRLLLCSRGKPSKRDIFVE